MTSKSSFWKYSIWNFKKRLWTFALCMTVWFFIMPVALFVETETLMRNYTVEMVERSYWWVRFNIINDRIAGGGWYGALVIAMGIFLALQAFAWMNQQNKVDMFKSVPVKSATRFWYINLNSLLIFLISFGGNLVLANIAASIKGIWNQTFFDASAVSFFMHLQLFLACYFVVLIAQCLTGNVVLGFLGGAILLVIEPLCCIIKGSLMNTFFKTHIYKTIFESFGNGIISPIGTYVKMYKAVSEKWLGFANEDNLGGAWIFITFMCVQILVYGAAAYVLYQKRPSQTSGKAIVFTRLKPVIKFVLMVVGSLCFSAFMADLNNEPAIWYGFFGAVCGLLVLQVILQTIMEGDFRESVKGKLSFAAASVVTLVIYFVFAMDITGYDTYLPKAERVESLAFTRGGDFVYSFVDEKGNYVTSDEYLLDNMKITDEAAIERVISVLQDEIEAGEYYYQDTSEGEVPGQETAEDGANREYRYEDDGEKTEVYLKFRLSGGREVVRSYFIKRAAVRECFGELYELPEYKEAIYAILDERTALRLFNRNNLPTVSYSAYNLETGSERSESLELARALFDALKEDVEKRSLETVTDQAPVGSLEFAAFPEKFMESYEYYPGVKQFTLSVPVYEEDEAAVELLKEIGWYQEPGIKAEDVAIITVYQMVYENENAVARKTLHINPGDPLFEQVAEDLLAYEATSSVADSGTFTKKDYWAEVTVWPKTDNEMYGYYQYSCQLRFDKFPAALEKVFENIEVDDDLKGVG
ncbi:MAG: hypothetical protein HDR00_07470 [Lachnospiraceae bacterium]|nr:hypothetical protein [Lachnospiraceae bacterium]